ncbi:MAG TPA: phosphoribosylformylglycinamidine synthase subunit PurQ [Spirochaetia bacterium]|nr:phosphoribosylformylglycinamidine synthase subunit PurQ [Spirochaetia bacterium]
MSRPRVCVVTGFGINADEELAVAFRRAGADAERVHVNDLVSEPDRVFRFRILAFPGGFSFGDHLGSGKVFSTLFRRNLGPRLREFLSGGGLAIGICNGFQVLVKMGVLPNTDGSGAQEVSLVHNDSGRYEDRWVRVRFEPGSRCAWTRGLSEMDLPVRHGEGRFVTRTPGQLSALEADGLVALRYASAGGREPAYPEDPNGSEGHVAGICDPTGRVFGLMPHPEAFLHAQNHPEWTARPALRPEGLFIFENGVKAAR